ncbi:MAG TPA: TIGR03986 family CRISPR-associated RAMP protein, partial [Campylobacterales bacterium]|nr:TIGR03986 family CRISPR-associated RAMP protein [Campylobacterales bacterium]
KSPIFVRDGKEDTQFCNHNDTPYIPSSSVKGMIRSVLEILSFSKMSQFNDDTYAVRDLRNRELYMSKMTPDNTFCGWLKKTDDGYAIEDCGKTGRIKHSEIDKIFNMDFASKFKQGKFGNKAKDKTAKVKYEMINSDNFVHGFEYVKKDINREIYRYEKNSTKKGTLVLTGQPSARKEPQGQKPSGKVYEFIFFDSRGDIKLSDKVMQNFLFAYFDGRKTEPKESPDWTYWKKTLEAGGKIPVFFQKNGKEVAHFGLSYLYKLPYSYSVKDGLPPIHHDSRKDLAQTMFGYIRKDEALKGRIQFSHFKAIQNVQELEKRTEILGSPRASYYPIYVKQWNTEFKTFMDSDFNIAGWKRYPIHNNSQVVETTDTGSENVGTTFTPLKEGVVFKGKVCYHNLKKAELGALLSALTFHNTKGCFHNIGMAKPLGYGKIELKIDGIDNIESYLRAFELEVTTQIEDWSKSDQIKELLSMATEQVNGGNSTLKYMELENFANSKSKNKDFLRSYTALDNISTIDVKSLISSEDLKALKVLQEEQKEAELAHQKRKREEEKHDKEWQIVYNSSSLATIEAFLKKYPNSKYKKTAEEMISNIEKRLQEAKEQEIQKEATQKWEAVLRVDKKYFEKALSDYIDNYPNSPFINEAKEKLDTLEKRVKQMTNTQELDFSQAKDAKSIER